MDLAFLFITIVLFLIAFLFDKLLKRPNTKLLLYDDNGKRVKIKVEGPPPMEQTEDCTTTNLKLCTISDKFSCGNCKEPLALCHHVENSRVIKTTTDDIIIPANKTKDEGYCLPLNESGSARSCTAKNGGLWIINTNANHTLFKFECYCSLPNYFVNSPIDNDCSQFVGCINGKMKNTEYNTVEEIDCDCNLNYESSRGTTSLSEAPQCILKNIFRWDKPEFPVLDEKFVSPMYLSMLKEDVKLPNPCLFDLAQNAFVKDIGQVQIDEERNIAYCVALKIGYTTTITNSDYLLNNNGNFSNSITSFTNNPAELIGRKHETLYEYHRTKVNTRDNVLKGVRVYYNDFKFKLDYLDKKSGNMGGPGQYYTYAPNIPLQYHGNAFVYVYNAATPTPMNTKDINLGAMMYWSPIYNTTGGMESTHRVYNGVAPLKGGYTRRQQMILYPLIPVPMNCKRIMGFGGLYGVEKGIDAADPKHAFNYALPLDVGNNFLSRLNTGVLLEYTKDNIKYTKPLTSTLAFVQKYRINYNPNFSVLHGGTNSRIWMYYISNCDNLDLADSEDIHMWPETSYCLETGTDGVGLVTPYNGKYKVEQNNVQFCDFFD